MPITSYTHRHQWTTLHISCPLQTVLTIISTWHCAFHVHYFLRQSISMHGTAHAMPIAICVDNHECTTRHIQYALLSIPTNIDAWHCTFHAHYHLCWQSLVHSTAHPIPITCYINQYEYTTLHIAYPLQSVLAIISIWHCASHVHYMLHQSTSRHGTAHPILITPCVDEHEYTTLHIAYALHATSINTSARHCTSHAHYALHQSTSVPDTVHPMRITPCVNDH